MNSDTDKCESVSELLILADGRILVHNLTPAFADMLHKLNPGEEQIATRTSSHTHQASRSSQPDHELPD